MIQHQYQVTQKLCLKFNMDIIKSMILCPNKFNSLVFENHQCFHFTINKLPGNIPDSKTVKHLLKELDNLGFQKLNL